MEEKKVLKTIELTPTWEATANMLISILESGTTAEGQAYAKSEIRRMGQIIDHLEERAQQLEGVSIEWL
mgnify:CR=1 FL=1